MVRTSTCACIGYTITNKTYRFLDIDNGTEFLDVNLFEDKLSFNIEIVGNNMLEILICLNLVWFHLMPIVKMTLNHNLE